MWWDDVEFGVVMCGAPYTKLESKEMPHTVLPPPLPEGTLLAFADTSGGIIPGLPYAPITAGSPSGSSCDQ